MQYSFMSKYETRCFPFIMSKVYSGRFLFEIHLFLVHGNWSEWTSWTQCTLDCGGGAQVRGRACVNPRPQYGGQDCEGDIVELGHCNLHPCPSKLNKRFFINRSDAFAFLKQVEFYEQISKNRISRKLDYYCDKLSWSVLVNEVNKFNDYYITFLFLLVHGGLTPWSSWTFCNKPCGNGTSDRRRSCTNPTPMYGGRNCSGETLQWNECNTHLCIRELNQRPNFGVRPILLPFSMGFLLILS